MALMQENDNQWVEQYLAGDEDAFFRMVAKYKKPITNYIYRMIGDYDQALDLTQETFLRVFRNIRTYRADYQFSTWIYRIASNLAIDEIRWRRRRNIFGFGKKKRVEDEEEKPREELIVDTRSLPDQKCMDSQIGGLLLDAIQSLPAVYRTVFVLKEMEDLDYEQISQTLDCSLGTVKSRLHRAKNLLQKKLAPYYGTNYEMSNDE